MKDQILDFDHRFVKTQSMKKLSSLTYENVPEISFSQLTFRLVHLKYNK